MTTRARVPPSLSPRQAVERLRGSKIREIVNAGLGRNDILPFWLGEPDEVTPDFIRQAGIASLEAGETFYSHNLGIPELRQAIAGYVSRLHRPTATDEVAVTASGMEAVLIAAQALLNPGDRVVVVTPAWPNVVEAPKILGADVVTVPLTYRRTGWTLDLDRLLAAITPKTVALFVNSPNNPTGWTMTAEDRDAILGHCRRQGTWIIEDGAYERLYYEGNRAAAPSFLDVAEPDERVISANTFSKAWMMTGWRLGWMITPRALVPSLGKLIEYNTSCSPVFVQRAGAVALSQGEPVVARTRDRFRHARDFLVDRLDRIPGIDAPKPPGTMYVFFRVRGVSDSFAFCQRLVTTQGLGLAPGIAFGSEGEGFMRWCFATTEEKLADGVERLRRAMERAGTAPE